MDMSFYATINPVTFIADFIGTLAGLYALALIYNMRLALMSKAKGAFGLLFFGVVFMTISFVMLIVPIPKFAIPLADIHHWLMTIGMLGFVYSVKQFTGISTTL